MTSLSFAELRQIIGLSVEEAADELGYCSSTVYRWERGESAPKASVYRALEVLARFNPEESPNWASGDIRAWLLLA